MEPMLYLLKTSFILLLVTTAVNLIEPTDSKQNKKPLIHIKKFANKYPSKVRLLNDDALVKRLKSLLKNRFLFLKNTWAVETPIEIKNKMFSAWGCQQHNCSNTNFMIVVDFSKNVVFVGIREEEKVKIYSEDGSSNILVSNWANRTN